MAMEMASAGDPEEGEGQGFRWCDRVRHVKNNDAGFQCFRLQGHRAEHYSEREWQLLGRYIADNDHLTNIHIETHRCIGDAQLSVLCRTMVGSRSLKSLLLGSDGSVAGLFLALGGIQSLLPFIKNSPNLTSLRIVNSENVESSCFALLMRALDGRPIEQLTFSNCSVNDITTLGYCSLPRLERLYMANNSISVTSPLENYTNLYCLDLSHNNIGKEGSRSLAKLLQNERSSLTCLLLSSNHIDDEAAEILAKSIKHNTRLTELYLGGNNIKEAGCRVFLKLLNDSSSIESTYNSNQTLQQLELAGGENWWLPSSNNSKYKQHIDFALRINFENRGDSHAIGKAKVVATQLNSARRRELCRLQEIEYSFSTLLSEMEPHLLPDLIAVTGREHGQSELYLLLVAAAPDLTALIDARSMLKEAMARNTAQIEWYSRKIAEFTRLRANLNSENAYLNRRLDAVTLSENTPPSVTKDMTSANGCGNNKKRRSARS